MYKTGREAKKYYIVEDYVFDSLIKAAAFAVDYAEKHYCSAPDISIRNMNSTDPLGYATIDSYTDELWVNGKATGRIFRKKNEEELLPDEYIITEVIESPINIAAIERKSITDAFNDNGKNVKKTAAALFISERTLKRKLKEYGIK